VGVEGVKDLSGKSSEKEILQAAKPHERPSRMTITVVLAVL
jgi:hypothetical protein